MNSETAMLAPTGPVYDAAGQRMAAQASALAGTQASKEWVVVDAKTGMPVKKAPVPKWRQTLGQCWERFGEGWDHLPDFLMPWGFFSMVMYTFGLLHNTVPLSAFALLLGIVVPVCLFLLSRRPTFKALSAFCVVASIVGFLCGQYGYLAYVYEAGMYARLRTYNNVVATDSAVMYKDAAHLDFNEDSIVDVSRSAGYEWMGKKYCAAPLIRTPEIPDPDTPTVAEFWAIGKGCCDYRGGFTCGRVHDNGVHGGLVLLDGSPVKPSGKDHYMEAARMAAEVTGVLLPQANDPSLVIWGEDVESHLTDKWNAVTVYYFSAIGILAGSALLIAFLAPWLGVTLASTKQDKSLFPHPNAARMQQFGLGSFSLPWRSTHQLDQDLLHGRAYWSGEVYHDYAFHVANTHMFIGVIACHPLHPYTKFERLLVLVLVNSLLLFPAAALDVTVGDRAIIRVALVLLVVLIPRLCLKAFLEQVSEANDGDSLESGSQQVREAAQRNLKTEALIFAAAFVVVALVDFGCVAIIQSATDTEVGKVLWLNSYCLAYAFVVEALVDLVRPMHVDAQFVRSQRSQWCMGFFNRWIYERDASMWNPDYDKEYPMLR